MPALENGSSKGLYDLTAQEAFVASISEAILSITNVFIAAGLSWRSA